MVFFEKFFNKKRTESAVLIDIGADTLAAAYVHYVEGQTPAVLYARRMPIEAHKGETPERAMLRALRILGDDLIREGAPILLRETGSGSASIIVVSIDAPWQETRVRTEHFSDGESFVFTKDLVAKKLEKKTDASSNKEIFDESIIGTLLNGYETKNPYGQRVHRAAVVILSSLIHRTVAEGIISILKTVFHTKSILPIAGNSIRYQALRALFPHERDAIIVDVTGASLVSVALIRRGVFVTMFQVSSSIHDSDWVSVVSRELGEIAKEYPLPRTIFLLAREQYISDAERAIAEINFGTLWLSDNPPKIVPIQTSYITRLLQQKTIESPDLVLLLMVLYYQSRRVSA